MVKSFPKRGEIYWVDLEATKGSETQKTRPGLIISNDVGNEVSSVVIIAPITSKIKNVYPFEVRLTVQNKPGKVMVNQCRAVDKSRLQGKLDEISAEDLKLVEEAIKIVFGMT